MKLSEEFNPYNAKHVRAWIHLTKNGSWPESFLNWMFANDIEIDANWFLNITFKMADAWCQQMMEEFEDV